MRQIVFEWGRREVGAEPLSAALRRLLSLELSLDKGQGCV